MGNGLNAGKKLKETRKSARWHNKWFVKRALNLKAKADPLRGAHQAKGIVIEKRQIEAKQPNSAMRKCAVVQLLKNGNDEVIIECIGGKMGRAKGDIPCVRWQVIKVNDQSLDALLSGKIEKGRR